MGHNEQVDLSEQHKGAQHDDHGGLTVSGAPQGSCVDLIKAAQHVETIVLIQKRNS